MVAAVPMAMGGEDDFPIIGVYAKDQVCKGDGSDPADLLVKITASALRLHPRLSCGGLALSANLKAFRESLFNPSSIVVCI